MYKSNLSQKEYKLNQETEDIIDNPEEVDTLDIINEYFGDTPKLDRARVVDGGNFEAGSPIANEDSPILASNLYESAPKGDQEE